MWGTLETLTHTARRGARNSCLHKGTADIRTQTHIFDHSQGFLTPPGCRNSSLHNTQTHTPTKKHRRAGTRTRVISPQRRHQTAHNRDWHVQHAALFPAVQPPSKTIAGVMQQARMRLRTRATPALWVRIRPDAAVQGRNQPPASCLPLHTPVAHPNTPKNGARAAPAARNRPPHLCGQRGKHTAVAAAAGAAQRNTHRSQ